MQAGFGDDFGQVRIHDDARAAEAARSVGAVAYTLGHDIVFSPGAFRPHTPGGLHLVAHELAHVVQQRRAARSRPQAYVVARADDPLERAADRAAGDLMTGRAVSVPRTARDETIGLQRAVSEVCNPPSTWLALAAGGPTSIPLAAAFGLIAETLISTSVIAQNGIGAGNFYQDNALAGPIDPGLVAFILAKNPGLSFTQRALVTVSQVARPDVLMHQPPIFDFEEVKPNSVPGRAAGRTKLAALAAFYPSIPVPYVAGSTFTPPPPLVILSGTFVVPGIGPIPLKVSFQITRDRAGLLVYDICVETDWARAAATVLLMIALIIAAIVAAGVLAPVAGPVLAPALVLADATPGDGSAPAGPDGGATPGVDAPTDQAAT